MNRLAVVFGRSEEGVDFDAMDEKPVQLFFLTVAPPQDRSNLYLPVLGKIVETVKSAKNRRRLLTAVNFDEVSEILEEADHDG
jgi:mannitol/fructose-specific phosphotransferase system IIA component (Ntr-type)